MINLNTAGSVNSGRNNYLLSLSLNVHKNGKLIKRSQLNIFKLNWFIRSTSYVFIKLFVLFFFSADICSIRIKNDFNSKV